jgi:hypothetical protein
MRLPDPPDQPPSTRSRVFRTLLLAALGAWLGFTYARRTLDPELLDHSSLGGLYASAGAALLILAYRLYSVARFVVREVLRERRATRGVDDPLPPPPPAAPDEDRSDGPKLT